LTIAADKKVSRWTLEEITKRLMIRNAMIMPDSRFPLDQVLTYRFKYHSTY
jgi:hypothetical protein